MMVLESLLCGTPIVAFPVGYAADLLPDQPIGGLARIADSHSLSEILRDLLSMPNNSLQTIRASAREVALSYCSMPVVAKKYISFYEHCRL
jgi:glycosyltransferase involved in cell wall biosynthesis